MTKFFGEWIISFEFFFDRVVFLIVILVSVRIVDPSHFNQ